MAKREFLQEVIEGFEVSKFTRFLSAANSAFKPVPADFGHYLESDGYFSHFAKAGYLEFKDGSQLLVCTIRCDKSLTERTGKRKQYDLAKKVLKDTFADGGLFLFYDAAGHFRLSFVCAQYMGPKRSFSTYRRYTYYVSHDLSNKTFIKQVSKCDFSDIDEILEAFSIEAVSEEFYNEFKPKFDLIAAAVKGVTSKQTPLREDFALLFAIRIIFLGFVQKKGWLGGNEQFIQGFWGEYKKQFEGKNDFYDRWLTPLFFEALNSGPGHKVQWQNNDFSKATEAVLQMAPYLNGELFKPKKGIDDQGLFLPDAVIGDFIEWLFQYNFTIEENDLYDEELELNPEFLGIIFERLVNKADGAVYTPRTEVDLMCRLGLLNWLAKNTDIDKKELYQQFFREGGSGAEYDGDQKDGNFSANEIRRLVELLESVTVCDPAAGSGAFEVGMLHVINETLESLYDNRHCPPELVAKSPFERKKAIIGQSLYGVEVKRWAVWINQLRLWLTLFIDMPDEMKNSLKPLLPSLNFKIRKGDSIVQRVGGKLFPVRGHADVSSAVKKKITELKKTKLDFFYNRGGMKEEMLQQMETQVFRLIIQSEIAEIDKLIELRSKGTDKGASGPQLSLLGPAEKVSGSPKKLLDETKPTTPIRDIQLDNRKRELLDEMKILAEEHPLVWSIEFSEVFYDRGGFDIIIGNPPYVRQEDITDPDGSLEPKAYKELLHDTMRLDYPKYFKDNSKINGKSDLYTYFYLRSLHLLNEKGVHVFICSNSWLDVGYGTWMQEFLLNNTPVRTIIDNHARRSFASADVNTIISVMDAPLRKGTVSDNHIVKFVAFKKPFEECIFTENFLELEAATEIHKNDVFRVYPITNRQLYDEGWEVEEGAEKESGQYIGDKWGGKYLRAPDIFFTILQKGRGKLIKLKDIADVRFGIKTGCNEFFYLTDQQAKEWGIEKEFLKPVIKSPRECRSIYINKDELKFKIFICNKSKADLKGTNALKYIQWGERQEINLKQGGKTGQTIKGYHNIPSVSGRKYWYGLGLWNPPAGIIPCGFGDIYRFFANQPKILADKRLYLLYPNKNKDTIIHCMNSTLYNLFLELGSSLGLGDGLLDITVEEFQKTKILFVENVEPLDDREIGSVFWECGLDPKSEIPISEQEPKPLPDRKELDDIVFDALNLTQDERKEVYRAVCQLVWNRISKAKSVKKRK